MTLTIELTSEEETRLSAAAAEAGVDPVKYLRLLIDEKTASVPHQVLTGRLLVEHLVREGVIGSGFGNPKLDSPEAA